MVLHSFIQHCIDNQKLLIVYLSKSMDWIKTNSFPLLSGFANILSNQTHTYTHTQYLWLIQSHKKTFLTFFLPEHNAHMDLIH